MKNSNSPLRNHPLLPLLLLFLALVAQATAQTCDPPPANIIGWWDGEVSGSTALDIVGGNNGSTVGGVIIVPGEVGNAFKFDGASGYIAVADTPSLNFGTNGPFTLEGWFNWDGGGAGCCGNIIRKSNYPSSGPPGAGYLVRVGRAASQLEFFAGDTTDNTLPGAYILVPITPGAWHHFAATRDSAGTMDLYLDGQLAGTATAPNANTTSSIPFTIGAWSGSQYGPVEFFSGEIDAVSVYNRALGASEIQAIFNAGSAGKCMASSVSQWTELSFSGGPPQARYGHTAVLNPSNGRMIVFGGDNNATEDGPAGLLNDVWIFQDARTNTGNTWQQLTVSGTAPSPRLSQSAVYDQVNNRMIIFGGDPDNGTCYVGLNDVWVLTNADGTGGTAGWTELNPTGTPPSIRANASAVYDQADNCMIIYGGNESCEPFDSDLWVLTYANGLAGTPSWSQLSQTAGGPGPRTVHSAFYDSVHNKMILFGGQLPSGSFTNDTWILSNANGLSGPPTWTFLNPTGPLPAPRESVGAAYDQALNTLVVFGGETASGPTNDTWILSNANGLGGVPAWTPLTSGGAVPGARWLFSCVEVPGANRIVIYDGASPVSALYNDVWALQYANPSPGPTLNIASAGNQSVLYWSASATNYVLQTTTNLSSPNWVTVTNGAPIIGLALTNTLPAAYFRLEQQ
jgi:hypothetical protein